MYVIPKDRLPEGFAERIDEPPADPAPTRPAATIVLLRDAAAGPEVLLLRRHRATGFVPGAFVFPGGRVDDADADPRLLDLADGLDARGGPEPTYWIAAVREAFEEAGILLARDAEGGIVPDAGRDARVAGWREALLAGRAALCDVVHEGGLRLDLGDVVYCAHWITPIVEPRRYDTRFFLARLPDGCDACVDAREMTDAVWLTPAEALRRFRAGRLPMVFPTVATLESLAPFRTVAAALDAFRGRPVAPILPRLVRTDEGVTIVVDGEAGG
ncbi:MAG TPA: NUDIX domain-containing protein [Longimicrobiales bacterium]